MKTLYGRCTTTTPLHPADQASVNRRVWEQVQQLVQRDFERHCTLNVALIQTALMEGGLSFEEAQTLGEDLLSYELSDYHGSNHIGCTLDLLHGPLGASRVTGALVTWRKMIRMSWRM
jgi:hypothetical protein